MAMRPTETNFDRVVPTGWLTAYGRSFSDLPYAHAVFQELERERQSSGPDALLEQVKDDALAAKFEARYKLIDRLVRESGAKQVLEFASGLSTRGLTMTSDPEVVYVELDLPLMMRDKRKIFEKLQFEGVIPIRHNLHLEDGNAMEQEDMKRVTAHFDKSKPIAIITEGLLRYLSLDEQRLHAEIVVDILKRFGGVWLTPDISLVDASHGDAGVTSARRKKITELTGKNVSENRFGGMQDAVRFFEEVGFTVKQHEFSEVIGTLVSPKKLLLTAGQVQKMIEGAVVFEMRQD